MTMSMFAQCQDLVVEETKSAVHDTLAVCGFDVYHKKTEAELKEEERKKKEDKRGQ